MHKPLRIIDNAISLALDLIHFLPFRLIKRENELFPSIRYCEIPHGHGRDINHIITFAEVNDWPPYRGDRVNARLIYIIIYLQCDFSFCHSKFQHNIHPLSHFNIIMRNISLDYSGLTFLIQSERAFAIPLHTGI